MKKTPAQTGREFRLFLVVRYLVSFFPIRLLQWKGAVIGALFFLLSSRRRIVLANLEHVFGERSPWWRLKTGVRCGMHFGRISLDFLKTCRWPANRFSSLVHLEGAGHVGRALEQGKGVFILSGHFGHWETAAQALAIAGYPQAMVYRPLDNPLLDEELRTIRTRFGNTLIEKKGAMRGMLTAINDNRVIDILIDQYVPPDLGVETGFLGVRTFTTSSLAKIVLKTGTPILPLFSYPAGKGYRVIIGPPVQMEGENLESLTGKCDELLSSTILAHPELWLWFHDRWGLRKTTRERPVYEEEPWE